MDQASQALMRASLHDLANVLSGIRGIFDLCPADKPLSARNRDRLDSVLVDGLGILERSRHLALGIFPNRDLAPGADWRTELQEQLTPMVTIFRCQIELSYQGDPAQDRWPGELLRGYVHALVRQVLPYVHTGTLQILCDADEHEWRIRFSPVDSIPEKVRSDYADSPKDISAYWAQHVGSALNATLACEQGCLLARIPRHPS